MSADNLAKNATPSTSTQPPGSDGKLPAGAKSAKGGASVGGFTSDPASAKGAGRHDRRSRGPDDHDTNINGAPLGPPSRKLEPHPRMRHPEQPNLEGQPAELRRAAQATDTGRRPRRYSHKQLALMGLTVLYNEWATTEDGENYIRQRPAIVIEALDEPGTRVDLLIIEDGSSARDCLHAVDETCAADGTWSFCSRF